MLCVLATQTSETGSPLLLPRRHRKAATRRYLHHHPLPSPPPPATPPCCRRPPASRPAASSAWPPPPRRKPPPAAWLRPRSVHTPPTPFSALTISPKTNLLISFQIAASAYAAASRGSVPSSRPFSTALNYVSTPRIRSPRVCLICLVVEV